MSRYTVLKNHQYRAVITLGFFKRLVSNATVAAKFTEIGFSNVQVTGVGGARTATGWWRHNTASAEIPAEITKIWILA